MKITLQQLVQRMIDRFDPDDIVDMLDISTEELLDKFIDKVADKYETFDWLEEDYDEQEGGNE